jgi:hypothetical protein
MTILVYRVILDIYEEMLSKPDYREWGRSLILKISPESPDYSNMVEERDIHMLLGIARAALDEKERRLRNSRTES